MARAERLDNPERAKTPEEVYSKVQAWVREYEEVTGIEPDLIKSDTYKVLAIKKILTGKVRDVVGLKLMWTYGDLLATVKEWSLQTRVESRDAGNMNVDQVRREESPEEGKEGTQATALVV